MSAGDGPGRGGGGDVGSGGLGDAARRTGERSGDGGGRERGVGESGDDGDRGESAGAGAMAGARGAGDATGVSRGMYDAAAACGGDGRRSTPELDDSDESDDESATEAGGVSAISMERLRPWVTAAGPPRPLRSGPARSGAALLARSPPAAST